MRPQASQPASVRKAIEGNLIERLPLTFQPFLNQEIRQWEFKFPYEQKYFECLVAFLENLPPDQFEELFRGVRQIESTMGIDRRQFSKEGQTMREASILTRSPHYLSWRQEINRVFEQINRSAFADEETRSANLNRLILLVFPSAIPVDPQRVAKRWAGSRLIRLDWGTDGAPRRPFLEMILKGSGADGKPGHGFLEEYAGKPGRSFADLWVLEPGTSLRNMLDGLRSAPEGPARAVLLSFDRLKPFREGVLENIKSMQRDISDADALYKRLRALDVSEWCPPEVRQVPAVREFIRALFLTGNGSPLFSNAFVEWGAVEAMAHARPTVVVAEFGLRDKPKPFTSVAVFENQERATPEPPVPDPEGSAVDAVMLAYYIWLGAGRYAEYQRVACLCLFENAPYVLVTGTREFPLWKEEEPVQPDRIAALLRAWLG